MSPPIPSPTSHRILQISPAQRAERFDAAVILARVLEGNDPELRLSEALQAHSTLEAAVQSLPQPQRERLQRKAGSQYDSLLSLAREQNPDRFYEALTDIGLRMESEDRFAMAARIYRVIVEFQRAPGAAPPASASRAQRRLALLSGGGSWGDRFEFWGERVARQTMDPALLLGIGFGTLAYRSVRAAYCFQTLRWIAAAERAGVVIVILPARHYGILARILAGGLGIAAEAPAFVLGHRLGDAALGREARPELDGGIGGEVASTYLMLGALRAFGGLASAGARRMLAIQSLENAPLLHRAAHEGAMQVGMFGGLVLAHQAETVLGLRPARARSEDVFGNSLRMLLQVNMMRPVARGILGENVHTVEQSVLEGDGFPPRPYD